MRRFRRPFLGPDASDEDVGADVIGAGAVAAVESRFTIAPLVP